MKIVVLDGYTLNPGDISWSELEKLGQVTIYDRTNAKDTLSRIKDADAVYTNKTPLSKEIIKNCKKLKFIGVLATGYNVVDVEAAKECNIVVSNVPSYGTQAVGQFAIAMLLEICHHITHHSNEVHNGRWQKNKDWCFWDYPLIELSGKNMGIIGFGRIGQSTGAIAKAMGMNILAYDSFENETGKNIAKYVSLTELLNNSDVIALHCPLFEDTKGIICKENISKMKDGVIILNNSRGPLIIEEDLADALNDGKVYAAGLDVVSIEPIVDSNPLLKAKNCIITPHISWASKESRARLMDIAIKNLENFKNGSPTNKVN